MSVLELRQKSTLFTLKNQSTGEAGALFLSLFVAVKFDLREY
jgi:hypothetical protein